jgi:hypothetical protein
MNRSVLSKLKIYAAVVGGSAVVVLGVLAGHFTQNPQMAASGSSGGSPATTSTTPPTAPAIEKASPAITGPAPLYAGQAPNSNPQAGIP